MSVDTLLPLDRHICCATPEHISIKLGGQEMLPYTNRTAAYISNNFMQTATSIYMGCIQGYGPCYSVSKSSMRFMWAKSSRFWFSI